MWQCLNNQSQNLHLEFRNLERLSHLVVAHHSLRSGDSATGTWKALFPTTLKLGVARLSIEEWEVFFTLKDTELGSREEGKVHKSNW